MKHLMNSRWLRLLILLLAVCVISTGAEAQTTGTITGQVKDHNNTPIAGISVGVFDSNQVYKTMSQTNGNGNYELTGLQIPGQYKIYFSTSGTDYIAKWYDSQLEFIVATTVDLSLERPIATLNDTFLAKGGTISGTISDAVSGSPISNVTVQAFDANDSSIWFSGTTDATGSYSITGLITNKSYKIRFRAFGTNYITSWYSQSNANNTVADEGSATIVTVITSSLVSAKLTTGGVISGKITIKETGSPLSNARVNVYSSGNILQGYATTGEQGQYTVSGLLPGSTYKIQFFERIANSAGAGINKWYNEQTDFSTATSVNVGAVGAENINAVFSGAVISGAVKNEENALLPSVIVTAYDNSGNTVAVSQPTGNDGLYKIEGLKRGGYKLHFKPLDNSGYASKWHNNKMAINSADIVTVSSLADRPTIDTVLLKIAGKLIPIYNVLLLKKRCLDADGNPMHCNCFEADGTPAYCSNK